MTSPNRLKLAHGISETEGPQSARLPHFGTFASIDADAFKAKKMGTRRRESSFPLTLTFTHGLAGLFGKCT
jgi:hypothetical protein